MPARTENRFRAELEAAVAKAETLVRSTPAPAIDDVKKMMAEVEDVRTKFAAEDKLLELRATLSNVPEPQTLTASSGWAGVRKQLMGAFESGKRSAIDLSGIEHRALTSNGTGVNTAPGIVRTLVDGGKLRSKCALFLGKNAQTVVPVFSPSVAVPVGSVPGATGTSSDATAVLAGDPLTLKPYYSTLAISMGALMSSDIESELPAIFAEAFGAAIDKQVNVGAGSGSDMLGVYIASSVGVPTSSDVTATGSAASPTWADYLGILLTLIGLGGDQASLCLVVNPAIFSTALGAAATGYDPMKTEFLLRQTVLGVPVILSAYALTTLTAGSYVAVAGYFKHYALAIAMEIHVDQIKTVGSDNITFQAFMYMQGKPLIGGSFRRLKTGA